MSGPATPVATAAALGVTAAAVDWLWRRRLRRTQRAMREQHAQVLAGHPSPEQAAQAAIVAALRDRPEPARRGTATPITDLAHARLQHGDVATVESRLEGHLAELYAMSDGATRRRLALNFAAAYEVTPVTERAGISSLMPPSEVHAMARGPIDVGGDFHVADLLFEALDHAGVAVPDGGTVLDFGSSSGRVLRAVASGRPDLACLGCDPNDGAIAWASEHLPMARFFVSPQRPPLALSNASVDVAYAVSIWSHFAEAPAVAWLSEMHRIVAPGGALVMTTHGLDCLTTLLRREHVSEETAAAAATAMLQGRLHFVDVFGPEGDWGVQDAGWGNAYFSLEWLLAHSGEDWVIRANWSGALDQVQDVIVLERR